MEGIVNREELGPFCTRWSGPGGPLDPNMTSSNSSASSFCDLYFVGGIYQLHQLIGEGSFGKVYLGTNTTTNQKVAIKIEKMESTVSSTLQNESRTLYELQGIPGIPVWKYYGEEEGRRVLVMELMGPNLQQLFRSCGGRFSLKTVLMLADQLLTVIEQMHARSFIHRDIKPENILTSYDPHFMMSLGDFGLAKRFRNARSCDHIPEKKRGKEGLVGTPMYASLKCHAGYEISRRDDLESLSYMMIYFLKGRLPWTRPRPSDQTKEERKEEIRQTKMNLPIAVLCQGIPEVIRKFLVHARNLSFKECPDYTYLRQMIAQTMRELNYKFDGIFDWMIEIQPNLSSLPPTNFLWTKHPDFNSAKSFKSEENMILPPFPQPSTFQHWLPVPFNNADDNKDLDVNFKLETYPETETDKGYESPQHLSPGFRVQGQGQGFLDADKALTVSTEPADAEPVSCQCPTCISSSEPFKYSYQNILRTP